MFDKIGPEDILVQVESSSLDNAVPEGIAVSNGIYDVPLGSSSAPPRAQGMDKNGNQNFTSDGVWTDITGYTVRSGYPLTTIVGGKSFVIDNAGSVVVAVATKFTDTTIVDFSIFGSKAYSSKALVRILLNGQQVATASGKIDVVINKVLNVLPGDVITLQAQVFRPAKPNNVYGNYPVLQAVGTSMVMNPYSNSALDFEEDMAYGSDRGFYDDTWGRWVSGDHLKKGLPYVVSAAIFDDDGHEGALELSRGNASGPILAQNRHPIPVVPGSAVSFKGTFQVRRTGSKDEATFTGAKTALQVRMSIWGVGVSEDEYGVERLTSQELYFYQAELQPSNSESFSMVEFVAPTGLPPGIVPQTGVSYIFWTCSLVQTVDGRYAAGTFQERKQSATSRNNTRETVASPSSTAEMKYFGWKHTNPLELTITAPSTMRQTYVHPYSRTGVAYKNGSGEFFTNVRTGGKITFFGGPGASAAMTVYNYNGGVQGSSLGSFSAAAGERKTVTVNPTGGGGIRIVKTGSNDLFIESVVNETSNTLTTLKTRQKITSFVDINSDITKISVLREEGDTGSITIDFDSESLDPFVADTLAVGKKIRFLGRHYGEGDIVRPPTWSGEAAYTSVFVGIIKQSSIEYDYEDTPIIQIVCYDANDDFETNKVGVAFDTYEKYIPYLNASGHSVLMPNGFDVGGAYKAMNSQYKFVYRPSAHGEMSLAKALEMTRNTAKSYIITTRFNEIKLMEELDVTPKMVFTDGTAPGDISYGRIKKKAETKLIVNKLDLNENSLDPEDYKNRGLSQENGPPADLKYVTTKRRTATFTNEDSSKLYGENTKSFDVIRGDGDLKKLYRGNIGSNFDAWADGFLSEHSSPKLIVHEFTVPLKNSDQIRKVCSLDLLDTVTVIYKGSTYTLRIKEIEHTVMPGRWYVVFKFSPTNEMTLW